MIPSQRAFIIQNLLKQNGVITVDEVRSYCGCSAETARRDLRRLEDEGWLLRTHGGAVLAKGEPAAPIRVHSLGMTEARTALVDRADALIITPKDTRTMRLLVERCRRAGVPVIAEATRYPGAKTVVAVDNYRAGFELGQCVATYARQHLGGRVAALCVNYPQPNTEARARGFEDGLRELPVEQRTILRVDGQGLHATARQIAGDALSVSANVNVIFGVNDDSALGALEAYRALGLDESHLLVALFGLEGQRACRLLEQGTPYTIAVAMFPELVGRTCVDAAVCAYHNCPLPERIITPFAIVTPDTLSHYYQLDPKSGEYTLNWLQAEQLASASPGFALMSQCQGRAKPRRIGSIQVFSSHEWYQNVRRAMQERCRSLGISLEVVDASQDVAHEIEALKQAIGEAAASYVQDGDTVILDSGRTTAYLAHTLRGRQNLTVITNSLAVLDELRNEPGITLVSSGGVVRRETNSLVGPGAEATFRDLRADRAFLAVTGVSLSFGLSNTNIAEAAVKQAILAAAREVILLADYSKIGVESLIKIAPLERVHRLITDGGISAHDRLALIQRGIEVAIANGPSG